MTTRTQTERRQHIWRVIRSLNNQGLAITATEIRARLLGDMNMEAIRGYVRALSAAGILVRTEGGYLLAQDTGIEAPRVREDGTPIRQGKGREQLWTCMRVLRQFDTRALAATASTDEWSVTLKEAQDYCRRLARAGFLVKLSPDHYRVVQHRIKGGQPIQVRRGGDLYDPNTGRAYSPNGEERP